MSDKGMIFDIKRFSIHDGPGVRTTIFFKGCPLSCLWCHNPESQIVAPELMIWPDRCIGCKICVSICPRGAVGVFDGRILTDRSKCDVCGICAENCPATARELVGRFVSVDELMKEIEKDIIFYDESGGGVTMSGGEPLLQSSFLYELLSACKDRSIHTAVDTSGYVDTKDILKIAEKTDLFLYDLKIMDEERHLKYTGVSNRIILENIRKLDSIGSNIFARFPLIPEVNDDDRNITDMAEFVASLKNVKEIAVLPYHKGGVEKAKRIAREGIKEFMEPSKKRVEEVKDKLMEFGLKVRIGG